MAAMRFRPGRIAVGLALIATVAARPSNRARETARAALQSEHIRLKRAEPGVNDTVSSAREVRLWFSESVVSIATTIRVTDHSRKVISTGDVNIEPGDLGPAYAPIREHLAPGVYTVDWRTTATDGDAMNGSFIFTVVAKSASAGVPPSLIIGDFDDDYKSRHTVTASTWTQHPRSSYRIVKWVPEQQYLIAQNDSANRAAAGKWTRIDWLPLAGMAPYDVAFCFSAFDKATAADAEASAIAKRDAPKTGCNGFPFSRLKRR